jgi:hypothetical protein
VTRDSLIIHKKTEEGGTKIVEKTAKKESTISEGKGQQQLVRRA